MSAAYYEEFPPEVSAEDHSWTARAACRTWEHIMYPAPTNEEGVRAAKARCGQCPVLALCLSEALDRQEQWGVWGSTTPEERWAILKRKDPRLKRWSHLRKRAAK